MATHDEQHARAATDDPLAAVAQAAGARLRAQADEDADGERVAAESLVAAASTAMAGGVAIREIMTAEARGKAVVRDELRPDGLKRVQRTAQQVRDAKTAHEAAVGRAMRIELSTRDIAEAAGVTHGTIRAMAQRRAPQENATTPGEPPIAGESA
jgi:DNA-binding NarL/FixJ family response regulator